MMKIKDIVYYLLLVAVIMFMAYTVSFLYNNRMALSNPFIFGASEMGNVHCSCSQERDGKQIVFYFNDTSFWQERQRGQRAINYPSIEDLDALIPEDDA